METFHCYEFLLMKKFQEDTVLWEELKTESWVNLRTFLGSFQDIILKCNSNTENSECNDQVSRYKRISADLWFLAVALEKSPHRLLKFLRHELELEWGQGVRVPGQTVLSRYLAHYNFVEMHLDSVFKYGEVATLPPEVLEIYISHFPTPPHQSTDPYFETINVQTYGYLRLTTFNDHTPPCLVGIQLAKPPCWKQLTTTLLHALLGLQLAKPPCWKQLTTTLLHALLGREPVRFQLFKCRNVRILSLKYNNLEWIPPDVGRMSALERLSLTNNRLQNQSIPFTLTFCRRLTELYLDNNLLDALPGFLLAMPQLCTVHRHGNHNYFKATFMWYHTDVNERVLRVCGVAQKGKQQLQASKHPDTLVLLAARAVMASKCDFFQPDLLPVTVQDYIAQVYPSFNVCGNCPTVTPLAAPGQWLMKGYHTSLVDCITRFVALEQAADEPQVRGEVWCKGGILMRLSGGRCPGYKVYTFKNPYLGNTCVPFQHWACSLACAKQIEVPAHMEQMRAAERMDREYNHYIQEFQVEPRPPLPSRGLCTLV
ncbi:unnamed protein product [Timema podura]|uniref:Uncharacterized protein n=1 Tax=Timema podura TaxID=61482 RepID=A0ABN7NRV3_TIMPD|nr:unnamed protein product [Timema podura]